MASGYLNSPEYQMWAAQQEAAMQQQPLYSPFATIAKALQGGLATYGGKKSQAEYDAKQAKNASLLASLLQKQPVDTVAGTPSLINDTGGAEYQSRKDLGAYDQPTSQSPDNSQILAGLLASGNQDAISQYVPGIAQAQLEANARANEPPTQLEQMRLKLEARRTDPNYLGAVAQAQRPSPEYAGQVAGAQAAGQLPSDLEKLNAQQGALDTRAEADRASRERAAAIRAGGTSSNVQSVQPLGDGTLLKVFRDGHTEITALDGSPVKGARNDPTALYNQGAATAAGKAGGTQAEAFPVVQANFDVINKTLDAFDDPGIKAEAPKAIGFGSMLPTVPGYNSNFRALRDQLQGQAFLQAFNTLKGGGQITEVEGSKATAAIARLNAAQTPSEFYKALDDARGTFKTLFESAKARSARGTAAVPQLQGGAAPQQQGAVSPAQNGNALSEAKAAIAAGAPREAVIQRLRQNGIDPSGL